MYIRYYIFFFALLNMFLHADQSPAEECFTNIYKKGLWGRVDFSGGGSEYIYNERYARFLERFVKENEIQSVVDLGCGDWLISRHINWGSVQYLGLDVVPHIIEKLNTQFATENIQFSTCDCINEELPEADLLICKDVLQHLTNSDISKIIKQFDNYKYVIIVNSVEPGSLTSTNPDIERGSCRPLDISKPPFSVPGRRVSIYVTDGGTVLKHVYLVTNQPPLKTVHF